jgi:hypothetical protein
MGDPDLLDDAIECFQGAIDVYLRNPKDVSQN